MQSKFNKLKVDISIVSKLASFLKSTLPFKAISKSVELFSNIAYNSVSFGKWF